MDLNDVAVFVRVAREKSFTRAAAALGLPKSTVSERVARLEAQLGVRLLDRTTRSLRLTDAGAQYFARVDELMTDLEDAESAVTSAHKAPRGVLRVGSPLLFAQAFLADFIPHYLEQFPDVEVELILGDRGFDLIEEGLDLAIHVIGPIEPSMIVRKLGMGERISVASPSYVAARGEPRAPAELLQHSCLVPGTTRKTCWTFTRGGESENVSITARYSVSSVELVYRAVLRGLGISVLPAFLCHDAINDGRLVRVLPEWSAGENVIQIVFASSRHISARARAFADLLVEGSAEVLRDLPRFGRVATQRH